MKSNYNKGIIPFRMIKKYKYVFFSLFSVIVGGLSWFLSRWINGESMVPDISIFASFWIFCIASFFLYSIGERNTMRHNKELE